MKELSPTVLPSKIGMLDSGVGGLSVLNALIPSLPAELVYVADAAHLPYGQKSKDFLINRATAITQFFESKGITTIFVACHTLSATAVTTLQALFPHVTYIDLLPLTIHAALASSSTNRIGVMATPTTIASHIHHSLIECFSTSPVTVVEQSCPDFVPLIEQKTPTEECMPAIKHYLEPLLKAKVDTIILGCTHYPFLQPVIEQQAPHVLFVSASNSLPSFVPSETLQPRIHFVTTASEDYIRQAVDHFFVKDHGCLLTFQSRIIELENTTGTVQPTESLL